MVSYCRHCAHAHCYNHPYLWSQVRQLAYIQFCLPVDSEGTASSLQAWHLLAILTKDPRIFTLFAWPKDLPVTETEEVRVKRGRANLRVAKTYVPQSDLEEYEHFKSEGKLLTHGLRVGATEAELEHAQWFPAKEGWSDVCDYHILRPRVPDGFLGRGPKTIVVGVFLKQFAGLGEGSLQRYVLLQAKKAGFPKAFPVEGKEESRKSYNGREGGAGITLQED